MSNEISSEATLAIEASKQISDSSDGLRLPGLWSFLWRGAGWGTIGSLIGIVYYTHRVSYARLFLLAFMMLLWIPAVYGSFVGAMLWLVCRKRSSGLNFVMRVVVGIGIAAATCFPHVYFT